MYFLNIAIQAGKAAMKVCLDGLSVTSAGREFFAFGDGNATMYAWDSQSLVELQSHWTAEEAPWTPRQRVSIRPGRPRPM